ncbi:MAG TPA: ZIP family metal transporter [Candidatus Paceibacterota bacterium]
MIFVIGIATFLSTLLGGLFALHLKDRLHLVLGFSAGAILGVAFFDLLPEALELAGTQYSITLITSLIGLGFAAYMLLDRLILLHTHNEDAEDAHGTGRGPVGAGSISFHSMLDGLGIGLALQISTALGAVLAVAVFAHNFSDGINTVNMILKNKGTRGQAARWLLADALAPTVGIFITFFISISQANLGLLLALFAGFLLYVGASDLLPESHHAHPVRWTTISTILGMVVLYAIISFAQI